MFKWFSIIFSFGAIEFLNSIRRVRKSFKLCLHYTGYLLRRHLENFTERGFCSHIRTVIWARFLPVSERSCAVLISKVETHTSGKCSVILYRIAFRIGTKRYLVSSERSLSYPPLIPLASRPFFSFQIQENRVNKGRYNILFLALFSLSQCFKETFNPIRPCRLSNVTCNPY